MSFWIENPSILFNSSYITQLWPYSYMNKDSKYNAVTRLVILLSLFGYMCINRFIILLLGLIIIGVIVLLYKNDIEGYTPYFKEYNENEINIKQNNPFNKIILQKLRKILMKKQN